VINNISIQSFDFSSVDHALTSSFFLAVMVYQRNFCLIEGKLKAVGYNFVNRPGHPSPIWFQ
jgi:hypothetical protein